MSKTLFTASYRKFLLKISITALLGFVGQLALAACPDPIGVNIESSVIGTTAGGTAGNETIYFCKQNFPDDTLTFGPQEEELLTGGSQAISKGSTIQTAPLLTSVDLTGFNVTNLAFKTLSANFPNRNGAEGPSPSLFNFYTKRNRFNDCSLQYPKIQNYLRDNPNTFQIDSTSGSIEQLSGTGIFKINKVKLKSDIDPSKELTADISFYHANAGQSQQYFTDGYDRYCWFGVGTKMTISPNNGNLEYSGDYKLNIGVQLSN